jgi:hypothetical protein
MATKYKPDKMLPRSGFQAMKIIIAKNEPRAELPRFLTALFTLFTWLRRGRS